MNKIENQSFVNCDSNISLNLISVSVLPEKAEWSDMEGFLSRKYGPFEFSFRNQNNDIVAGITFYVSYNCQGKYNSSGHYLAEATISPSEAFADPDCYFTCNVTAGEPVNYGTRADPVAGVTLKVQMRVISRDTLKTDDADSTEASGIMESSRSRLMAAEQFLNVIVRGDCMVYLISAYGY